MYKTEKRLMVDRIWWKDQPPELKAQMIKQQEYWQTLPYHAFKKLAGWNCEVYHIGEMPIRHLIINYTNLTEVGASLPLQNLKVHLLKRAQWSSLTIVSMVLCRRRYFNRPEWQVMMDFGQYIGITPYTFSIPLEWGRHNYKLRPIWNYSSAMQFITSCSQTTLYYKCQPINYSILEEDSSSVVKLEPDEVDMQLFHKRQPAKTSSPILEYSSRHLNDKQLSEVIASQVPHVHILSVNDNLLTHRSVQLIVERMPNLEELQIFGNKICDEGVLPLPRLKALKRLNLEDCDIHDNGVIVLSTIGTLQCLNISFNYISDQGVLPISSLKMLKSLKLFGNDISQNTMNRLAFVLPNCHIND